MNKIRFLRRHTALMAEKIVYPVSVINLYITEIRLYNFDPFKPHCYIVKLGFTGVFIILISALKHRLLVLIRTASLCFEQKYEKYRSFLSENFQFLEVKFSIYLNRRVFVMTTLWAYSADDKWMTFFPYFSPENRIHANYRRQFA